MSKTSDVAGVALSLLLTQAPARSRSYAYSVDTEQATILLETQKGFVIRTPGLAGAVEIGARTVAVKATGASLIVEASDGASAYGLRPWLTLVDELSMWPKTANHRQLWSAIVSAVPKVPGSRLPVVGTAGSPVGLGAEVWQEAQQSVHWRTSRRPGPPHGGRVPTPTPCASP
jgi:phage terminase large subunit-like protein